MDFNFSDEQEQLRDAVRKWVDKGYDFERHKKIVAEGGFSRAALMNWPNSAWAVCTFLKSLADWAWAPSKAWW